MENVDFSVTLDWKGEVVTEQMREACRFGIDSVTADCVTWAKFNVPVRTAVLQGSLQMRPARTGAGEIEGEWGSYGVKYARWIEEGTRPHVILPRNKKALYWKGAAHPVRMVNHPGTKARPYLIPAAHGFYPSLPDRIRARFAA